MSKYIIQQKLGNPVMYREVPNGTSFVSPVAAVRKLNKLTKMVEELEALLVRILVAGNVRPPTKLLEDIRAAIGEPK